MLDAYHSGKAKIIGKDKHGNPIVKFDKVTGMDNNLRHNRENNPTNIFKIKGTKSPSVVPIDSEWKP